MKHTGVQIDWVCMLCNIINGQFSLLFLLLSFAFVFFLVITPFNHSFHHFSSVLYFVLSCYNIMYMSLWIPCKSLTYTENWNVNVCILLKWINGDTRKGARTKWATKYVKSITMHLKAKHISHRIFSYGI